VEEYEALAALHVSLLRRPRPEEIARLVLDALPRKLGFRQRRVLRQVASSTSRTRWIPTPNADFSHPVGGARQVAAATRLFDLPTPDVDPDDPASLRAFAERAGARISASAVKLDFLEDRLDRAGRAAAGIEISKRQYNRQFRVLRRIAAKASTVDKGLTRRGLALRSRAGLTAAIEWDRFRADTDAACFVAYYTARQKLVPEAAYDEAAAMLFRRCREKPGTDWWMVALAYAPPAVLGKLSDTELAEFLKRAHALGDETRWTAPEGAGHDQDLS
jgi:hypothetical protein